MATSPTTLTFTPYYYTDSYPSENLERVCQLAKCNPSVTVIESFHGVYGKELKPTQTFWSALFRNALPETLFRSAHVFDEKMVTHFYSRLLGKPCGLQYKIQVLRLKNMNYLSLETFNVITFNQPQLTELEVYLEDKDYKDIQEENEDVDCLSKALARLTKLTILRLQTGKDCTGIFNDDHMHHLVRTATRIQILEISHLRISDKGFMEVTNLQFLRCLQIGVLTHVKKKENFKCLKVNKQLSHLFIYGKSYTNLVKVLPESAPSLQSLALDQYSFREQETTDLGKFASLTTLSISFHKKVDPTSQILQEINKELPHLTKLSLKGWQVWPNQMAQFASFTDLKKLKIGKTSPDGKSLQTAVDELKKKKPTLSIDMKDSIDRFSLDD